MSDVCWGRVRHHVTRVSEVVWVKVQFLSFECSFPVNHDSWWTRQVCLSSTSFLTSSSSAFSYSQRQCCRRENTVTSVWSLLTQSPLRRWKTFSRSSCLCCTRSRIITIVTRWTISLFVTSRVRRVFKRRTWSRVSIRPNWRPTRWLRVARTNGSHYYSELCPQS